MVLGAGAGEEWGEGRGNTLLDGMFDEPKIPDGSKGTWHTREELNNTGEK